GWSSPQIPSAMPKYWMITNRNVDPAGLGNHRNENLSFFTADAGPIDRLTTWTSRSEKQFRTELAAQADTFPLIPENNHEKQKHVTLFVHGYNNDWVYAARGYKHIPDDR